MKTARILLILALLCSLTTAFTEPAAIDLPPDFSMRSIHMNPDGSYLISGYTGKPYATLPLMAEFSTDGEILSTHVPSDAPENTMYSDAVSISENEIFVLRGDPDYTDRFQQITDGQIVSEIPGITNAAGLYPVSDGCLLLNKPDNRFAALITKRANDGAIAWQIDIPERIVFQSILTSENFCVAYGYQIIPEGEPYSDQKPTGIAVAFDHAGHILWRHDSTVHETFTGATWSANGNPVLSGRVSPTSEMVEVDDGNGGTMLVEQGEDRWYKAVLTEISPDGPLWRTEYSFRSKDGNPHDGSIYAHLSLPDGYLAAATGTSTRPYDRTKQENSLRMLHFDSNGTLQSEWLQPIANLTRLDTCELFQNDSTIHLIVHGKIESPIWEEAWSDSSVTIADIPQATLLIPLELP